MVTSDQTAGNEEYGGVLSFQQVTAAATAIGITAVPTPLTETSSDFYVYEVYYGKHYGASSVGGETPIARMFDSKAMRKFEQGDDFSVVVETDAQQGAIIRLRGRMLIKLH